MDVISYKKAKRAEELAEQIIDGSVDTGVLQTKINEKLSGLEAQYAPDLNGVKAGLVEKVKKGDLFLNVQDYGAKGDGTTDDTTAIQTAINDAVAKNINGTGITVFFPKGVYLCSVLKLATNLQSNLGYHYIRFTGDGVIKNGTLQIGQDGFNYDYVKYNAVVEGLRFWSDGLSATNAIELRRAYNVKIINCNFRNYNAGVDIPPCDLGAGNQVHSGRIQIKGCTVGDYGNGDNLGCNYLFRSENNITGGTMSCGDISIVDNSPVLVRKSAVYSQGLDGLLCNDNYFTCTDASTKEELIYVDNGAQIIISGNHLFEAGYDGIRLNKCQFIAVTGNNVVWAGQRRYADGIRLTGGDPSASEFCIGTITGNSITFPTRRGISVEDTCGHISISGNTVRDAGNTAHFTGTVGANNPYGIKIDSGTKYVSESGNVCTGVNTSIQNDGAFGFKSVKEQNGKTGNLALATSWGTLGHINFPKPFDVTPADVVLNLSAISNPGTYTIVPTNITNTGFDIIGIGSVGNTVVMSWRAII